MYFRMSAAGRGNLSGRFCISVLAIERFRCEMAYDSLDPVDNASTSKLVEMKAASRLASRDPTLFSSSKETEDYASRFMGWTTLATDPPYPIDAIGRFADEQRERGFDDVLLIGQGGSTQASMTMASFLEGAGQLDVGFHVMDSMSSEYLEKVWDGIDPEKTLFVVSSKSGSTLETMTIYKCLWKRVCDALGADDAGSRFVAITDPGSSLEALAGERGFAAAFPGEPTVGGRFSALSVFGLVPFALMGMDLDELMRSCAEAERACSSDSLDNPAIQVAGYLKEFRTRGRDKVCFNFSDSSRSLGLWLEQLIAESTGKSSSGLLPYTEPDIGLIRGCGRDRFAVVYSIAFEDGAPDSYGCTMTAREKCDAIVESGIPCISMGIDSPVDVACHMLVWEYAVAMYSSLVSINPFDQPDVESTKVAVKGILAREGEPRKLLASETSMAPDSRTRVSGFEVSPALMRSGETPEDIDDVLSLLMSSMHEGDFFSVNAFLPSYDDDRMAVLESLRHGIAESCRCATCLEIGPRYLHSIGQFQKGGFNQGVYLLLASEEFDVVEVPGEDYSITELAMVQTIGDFTALSEANRRVAMVFLSDSSPETLAALSRRIRWHVPSQLW